MPCRNDYDNPMSQPCDCSVEKKEANKWEAAFCAIVNEVDRKYGAGVLNTIFILARKNSGLDIKSLYDEHFKKDIDRLEKDLQKYSNDELSMLKIILNKNENL